MSAHIAHSHHHRPLPAIWIVILFVTLVVLTAVIFAALGHPVVSLPPQLPHPVSGPMA